jgi:hypothetical protein
MKPPRLHLEQSPTPTRLFFRQAKGPHDMSTPSVHVSGLTKSYGSFQAVKGVDFEIFPVDGDPTRDVATTERISMGRIER